MNAVVSYATNNYWKKACRPPKTKLRFHIWKETARAGKLQEKKKILPYGFVNVTYGKHKYTAQERKGF